MARLTVAPRKRHSSDKMTGGFRAGASHTGAPTLFDLPREQRLVSLCLALIKNQGDLSAAECRLLDVAPPLLLQPKEIGEVREAIAGGSDPLGDMFSSARSAGERRSTGAVYTPHPIVRSMVTWLALQGKPDRVVDPGAGSGRFTLAAGATFPDAQLIAVEPDPLAALILRANLAVHGWTGRATVLVNDYREIELPHCRGMTAFVGNPPYVRHHDIADVWKTWYAARFADLGIRASMLAGLHLHFFLQTRLLARTGDVGAFITSAEWMDVNYGSALRQLLVDELGGTALHVLQPTVEAFPGTATTAAITCFRVGTSDQPVRVRSVSEAAGLNGLTAGTDVPRERLRRQARWSAIVRPSAEAPDGEIELGELFRVHRGQVTGANGIWIAGEHARTLPERVKLPSVTKARDLIQAGSHLRSAEVLRRVIDLPLDLGDFSPDERRHINDFLGWARAQGGDLGYIARHRRA